ncbi:hypothetical protein L2E82_05382 [Cichorium intybus]|uniref:Uncharacterized protein n=1 Tax=Cichorium intybus TaxID=13427 RepID=A0ACB9H7Z7_CICIN|nr:hypothetical protein L2E82_05382 [Cichorium intybus]
MYLTLHYPTHHSPEPLPHRFTAADLERPSSDFTNRSDCTDRACRPRPPLRLLFEGNLLIVVNQKSPFKAGSWFCYSLKLLNAVS